MRTTIWHIESDGIEQQHIFQQDLDNLTDWGLQWGMHFNTGKCNVIRLTHSSKPLTIFYKMNGKILQEVELAQYLGITIHKSLEFGSHIRETVAKANKRLGFLKRNLKRTPTAVKKMAYNSLIRSGLEYGSVIWDPHLASQTKAVEAVQNRAIRWMMGFGPRQRCSISKLRAELELRTLEERRCQQRLTLLYKMVNGDVVVTPDDLGMQSADSRTRCKHGHKFREKRARTNRLKFSPVFRTIAEWNKLPALVAEAGSVDTFKSQLNAHRP